MNNNRYIRIQTCRYGMIEASIALIQGSNALVLKDGYRAVVGTKVSVLPAGTILVPDWSHGGTQPHYRIYKDLNAALRGISNAIESGQVNFKIDAEPPSRLELVFGSALGSEEVERMHVEHARRIRRQADIQKSLAVWREAFWLERERSIAFVRLMREAAGMVLHGRTDFPAYRDLCRNGLDKLACLPFADGVAESARQVAGFAYYEADGNPAYAELLEEVMDVCAEEERRQALEDVDVCLSRGESLIRRRRFRDPTDVENVADCAFNLLGHARAKHCWKKWQQGTLSDLHGRIGRLHGAAKAKHLPDTRYQFRLARNSLASLIGR